MFIESVSCRKKNWILTMDIIVSSAAFTLGGANAAPLVDMLMCELRNKFLYVILQRIRYNDDD